MPPGLLGLFRELHENGNDSGIFAGGRIDEEPAVNEGLDCALGSIVWIRRPNNGYRPELGVKKDCRLRHDQVGLEQVGRGNGCRASSHGVCAGVGIQSVKYVDRGAALYETQHLARQISYLKVKAATLGYRLTLTPAA